MVRAVHAPGLGHVPECPRLRGLSCRRARRIGRPCIRLGQARRARSRSLAGARVLGRFGAACRRPGPAHARHALRRSHLRVLSPSRSGTARGAPASSAPFTRFTPRAAPSPWRDTCAPPTCRDSRASASPATPSGQVASTCWARRAWPAANRAGLGAHVYRVVVVISCERCRTRAARPARALQAPPADA